jgi:hypothetical protein
MGKKRKPFQPFLYFDPAVLMDLPEGWIGGRGKATSYAARPVVESAGEIYPATFQFMGPFGLQKGGTIDGAIERISASRADEIEKTDSHPFFDFPARTILFQYLEGEVALNMSLLYFQREHLIYHISFRAEAARWESAVTERDQILATMWFGELPESKVFPP